MPTCGNVCGGNNGCNSGCSNSCNSCGSPILIQACQQSCNSCCAPPPSVIMVQSPSISMCAPSCSQQCSNICSTPACVSTCINQCTPQCYNNCNQNSCNSFSVPILLAPSSNCNSCNNNCMQSCVSDSQLSGSADIEVINLHVSPSNRLISSPSSPNSIDMTLDMMLAQLTGAKQYSSSNQYINRYPTSSTNNYQYPSSMYNTVPPSFPISQSYNNFGRSSSPLVMDPQALYYSSSALLTFFLPLLSNQPIAICQPMCQQQCQPSCG
ncbi:hypothetical protein PENTCL1PPCAC_5662, partial [Pristionchus entomophagus]